MAKPKAAGRTIYVATESFTTAIDGVPVTVSKNVTTVEEGHPLLLGREQFFRVLVPDFQAARPEVEQATAAPGEKRGDRTAW